MIKTISFLIAILSLVSPVAADQFLFLAAAKDSDLVSYRIDSQSGALIEHARLKLLGVGGPMSLSTDGEMLYVESHVKPEGGEQGKPHIISLRIKHGKFEQIHIAPVSMRSPSIHVDASGKNLLGAHFGDGAVSVWQIDAQRRCTGEQTDEHTTAKHAHFITTDPSNRYVYAPHTEPNAVFQFALDPEKGTLIPLDPPFAPGPDVDHEYHGPRHYAHHPTLHMGFTANERGGGISSWNFDDENGRLSLLETLSSLPADWEGGGAAADIHITPNGRFAYVSNRDGRRMEKGEPHGDTLAGFEIDLKTGGMKSVGHFPTGRFPRSFCIDTTGKFIFVACELDHELEVYRVNQETGTLKRIGSYETGKTPIWVTCSGHKLPPGGDGRGISRIIPVEATQQLKAIRDEIGAIQNLETLYEDRKHKNGLPYHIYVPKHLKAGVKYPMVMFLHGYTDLTIDTHKGFPKGVWSLPKIQKAHPHILFIPRNRNNQDRWTSDEYRGMTIKALDDLIAELNDNPKTPDINVNQVYVTGFSRGGQGTWNFIRTFPNKFAAAAPLSGSFHGPQNAGEAKSIKHLPIWIFNGDGDKGVEGSRVSFKALTEAGAVDVRYHEYKAQGHVIDDFAYFTKGFMDWLFTQKQKTSSAGL